MGPIEKKLVEEIAKEGPICFSLLDSEDLSPKAAANLASRAEKCGVSALLVGGSTAIDQLELEKVVRAIKRSVKVPVILFPGNVTGVAPSADAILFGSLLNSDNPYFITEAQALGALAVRKHGLEAIPMGYIVVGQGGAIGFVGHARGIPPGKPNLAAMYALAAQYMGMRFVYLEAGSGVTSQVSSAVVKAVRKVFSGTLVVGGGIRDAESAGNIAKSGADVIVVGTLLENSRFDSVLTEVVKRIKRERR